MKHLIALFVFTCVLMATAQPSFAQPEPRGGALMRILKECRLSDDQRNSVRELGLQHAKAVIAHRAAQATEKIELQQLFHAEELDRVAIERKSGEIADREAKFQMQRFDQWAAINDVLTPDQQKTWRKALFLHGAPRPDGPQRHDGFPARRNRQR